MSIVEKKLGVTKRRLAVSGVPELSVRPATVIGQIPPRMTIEVRRHVEDLPAPIRANVRRSVEKSPWGARSVTINQGENVKLY
jgi:hypothetical protein